MNSKPVIIALLLFCLLSCKLDKTIEVVLPPYEPKTMVECYLEPGKAYKIFLTKSISYFDSLYPIVQHAQITITYKGKVDTLKYRPMFDTTSSKFYLYAANNVIPNEFDIPYTLKIIEQNGQEITGETSLFAPVKIDTILYTYSNKASGNVSLQVKLTDNHQTEDYYRLLVNRNTLLGDAKNSDDLYSDVNLQSTHLEFRVEDRFDKNDTLIVTLAHISKELYDFSKSVKQAEKANGNPFVQPAAIKSNVTGNALGIFAGYTYSRDTIIIK
jgi:hypothetical protein